MSDHRRKIAIVHYRVGRTDGVSLEIAKRKHILEMLGYSVRLISGPIQNGANFIIDELEFERPDIVEIKESSFDYFKGKSIDSEEMEKRIFSIAKKIEDAFLKYCWQEKFDAILIHNIYSMGLHLPAASAFTRIAEKLKIPVIATHHDYYWERKEYQKPANEFIKNYLKQFVPPSNNNIVHVCINSLAQSELKMRRGINALILPDVFDFDQPYMLLDDYNSDFLETINVKPHDIFVLQATRIVERKGIELAIHFVQELEKKKNKLVGKRLYNGKIIKKDSSIVFVVAGYPEKFDIHYLQKLKEEINRTGIDARFIYNIIDAERRWDGKKIYSLWDAYLFADIITYPSLLEGWGNQLIEAIFYKKPVVLYEYPVFKADIKKEGYYFISLGDKIIDRNDDGLVNIKSEKMNEAISESLQVLSSDNTLNLMKENLIIGSKYHGSQVLEKFLKQQMNRYL